MRYVSFISLVRVLEGVGEWKADEQTENVVFRCKNIARKARESLRQQQQQLLKHIMWRWWLVREICATVCAWRSSSRNMEMKWGHHALIKSLSYTLASLLLCEEKLSAHWVGIVCALVETCHKDNDDGWVVMELVGCCDDGDSAQWLIVMESHVYTHRVASGIMILVRYCRLTKMAQRQLIVGVTSIKWCHCQSVDTL